MELSRNEINPNSIFENDGPYFSKARGESEILVNTDHPSLNGKNLHAPNTWANLLDESLREGLRGAAKSQLLWDPNESKISRLSMAGIAIGVSAFFHLEKFTEGDIAGFLGGYTVMMGVLGIQTSMIDKIRGYDVRDREWAMFYGLPLERFFAAQLLTRSLKLVREIN